MGEIVYDRAYYHCRHCGRGWFPTDEEFGIQRTHTPGAREVISLVGTLEPFAAGAHRVLWRLTGLKTSASSVQRTTEEVGEDVANRRAAGETFGPRVAWNWQRDAAGQRVAYISLDATAVRQQGPQAQKQEARMPWVASVFNPQPQGVTGSRRVRETRYVSGLMSLPELGAQLRRECRAVGVQHADVVIGLTDGGNGLEECLIDVLAGWAPDRVFILDFWHAGEHLGEFARTLIPHDEERRTAQEKAWCHRLKQEGGAALLQELETLDLSRTSDHVREAHRQLTGYFRHNLHRMDYPTYRAHGWQIGSGMIEAACKTVVGQRLKESGMRWRERGTTALCQLRSLYLSQPQLWENYWQHTLSP
jgi:hypothetical protein